MTPVNLSEKDIARFWSKVDIQGPDDCWNWTADCYNTGYGRFYLDRAQVGAHRTSWVMVHGPIPKGMHICHHCDNPRCVNPRHLFLGTQVTNVADMMAKGRNARGSANSNAKLTEDEVLKIRGLYVTGKFFQRSLATMFGVSRTAIHNVIYNKTWGYLR